MPRTLTPVADEKLMAFWQTAEPIVVTYSFVQRSSPEHARPRRVAWREIVLPQDSAAGKSSNVSGYDDVGSWSSPTAGSHLHAPPWCRPPDKGRADEPQSPMTTQAVVTIGQPLLESPSVPQTSANRPVRPRRGGAYRSCPRDER